MANMGLSNKPIKNQNFRVSSALALITQLGLTIGIMTAGGVFLGRWADGEDGTGLFTIIGTVAGLSAGLLSGWRLMKRALG